MRKAVPLSIIVILMCILNTLAYSQETRTHDDAIRFVQRWLSLIDENKYLETWGSLSGIFKKTTTKEQWLDDLDGFRKPLGKLLERKLLYVTESSDEHLGKYLIVQYQSLFENKISKGEAVSVVRDSEGAWKILGYSIF
jgi:hypothetical protein